MALRYSRLPTYLINNLAVLIGFLWFLLLIEWNSVNRYLLMILLLIGVLIFMGTYHWVGRLFSESLLFRTNSVHNLDLVDVIIVILIIIRCRRNIILLIRLIYFTFCNLIFFGSCLLIIGWLDLSKLTFNLVFLLLKNINNILLINTSSLNMLVLILSNNLIR